MPPWPQRPHAFSASKRSGTTRPHNAFTDLVRHRGRWWCTFREADDHGASIGTLRVLVSDDGAGWSSAGHVTEEGVDLRDPKLSVMPDGRLLLLAGGSIIDDDGRYLTRSPAGGVLRRRNLLDLAGPLPRRRPLAVAGHLARRHRVLRLQARRGEQPAPRHALQDHRRPRLAVGHRVPPARRHLDRQRNHPARHAGRGDDRPDPPRLDRPQLAALHRLVVHPHRGRAGRPELHPRAGRNLVGGLARHPRRESAAWSSPA